MLKAVVFDFDGTLVTGTNEGYIRCYHAAASSQGYQLSPEITKQRVLEQWGKAPRIELASVLREQPEAIESAVTVYEELLLTDLFSSDVVPIAGAAETLSELRRMELLPIVISGMPKSLLSHFSERFSFGFQDRELVTTIDTDDPAKQKPTGFHLRQEMSRYGWRSDEVVVVGDAHSDILMATSQSVAVLVVLTGFLTETEALGVGAREILASAAELPAMLRGGYFT